MNRNKDEKIRVMIVDDQSVSRHLLEMYVEHSEGFELSCSIASAVAADVYLLKNDVNLILMDILMSDGSNGLDAAERIKKSYPEIKIITTGATNQEVAGRLGISEYTVKTHVRNMLAKTGYASRTELAIKARVTGIAIGEGSEKTEQKQG